MEHKIGPWSTLAGPIIAPEEIDAAGLHRPFFAGVDVCARNLTLTEGFASDRPLHFCVTRTSTVNAMIARFNSPAFYGVAISEGACYNFAALATGLLSSEPLQRFISSGEIPIDDETRPTRTRREAVLEVFQKSHDLASSEAIGLASFMAQTAGYFLMAHEIGHLTLGHLPLFTKAHVDEVDGSAMDDHRISRTLERDADGFAAAAVIWYLGAPEVQAVWRSVHDDPQWGFRCFLAGSYILFTIMDFDRSGDPIGTQRTHPAPMVRVSSMAMLLAGVMDNWGAFSHAEIWDMVRATVRAVELALLDTGGGIMDPETAERLWAEAEAAAVEHGEVLLDLNEKLDRSLLDAYFWAQTYKNIA